MIVSLNHRVLRVSQPPDFQALSHNLPLDAADYFVVEFVAINLRPIIRVIVRDDLLVIPVDALEPGGVYKLMALAIEGGISAGVWWVDVYAYDPTQAGISFSSQGAAGVGAPGSFSGSVQVSGVGVVRLVVGVALDADPPYLLAQTQSDQNGAYRLDWRGYSGQLLVTALDNYGRLFSSGDSVGVGDRVHPVAPNGFVYESGSVGVLGDEPVWPVVAGESVVSGGVVLVAVPFYRPKSAGPFFV